MQSFLLPQDVELFHTSGYIKRQGPQGNCIKKTGSLVFNVIATPEGSRLFALPGIEVGQSSVSKESSKRISVELARLVRLTKGISRGYRRRLRLVGIGFRASRRERSLNAKTHLLPIHTKGFRRKRR